MKGKDASCVNNTNDSISFILYLNKIKCCSSMTHLVHHFNEIFPSYYVSLSLTRAHGLGLDQPIFDVAFYGLYFSFSIFADTFMKFGQENFENETMI